MPNTQRRSRFQVHLSTAIVLMFAAAGLLWANMREERTYYNDAIWDNSGNAILPPSVKPTKIFSSAWGWPYCVQNRGLGYQTTGRWISPVTQFGLFMDYWNAAYDLGIALAILFGVWYVCEWQIRRSAARKEG